MAKASMGAWRRWLGAGTLRFAMALAALVLPATLEPAPARAAESIDEPTASAGLVGLSAPSPGALCEAASVAFADGVGPCRYRTTGVRGVGLLSVGGRGPDPTYHALVTEHGGLLRVAEVLHATHDAGSGAHYESFDLVGASRRVHPNGVLVEVVWRWHLADFEDGFRRELDVGGTVASLCIASDATLVDLRCTMRVPLTERGARYETLPDEASDVVARVRRIESWSRDARYVVRPDGAVRIERLGATWPTTRPPGATNVTPPRSVRVRIADPFALSP